MLEIKTEPNLYYAKKLLNKDIIVDGQHSDAFLGLGDTGQIGNAPTRTMYLAEASLINTNDVKFGSVDSIKQMYLRAEISKSVDKNSKESAFFDVYKIKPLLALTEGDLTSVSGSLGNPVVLASHYSFSTPWFTDEFDGTGKYFIKGPESTLSKAVHLDDLQISVQDYIGLVADTNREVNTITVEMPNGGTKVITTSEVNAPVLEESLGKETVRLIKTDNSMFKVASSDKAQLQIALDEMGASAHYIDSPFVSRARIIAAGGFPTVSSLVADQYGDRDFNQFEETYVEKLTSDNSSVSNYSSSPDVRDIKDQTAEGPGDDDRFTAHAYMNLENGQTSSDGKVLHLKSFWENYSGTTSALVQGDAAQHAANPFGFLPQGGAVNCAKSQMNFACIDGIPRPLVVDNFKGGMNDRAFAPEIEIVMKIPKMGQAPFAYTGSSYTADEGISLSRSFSIAFSPASPDSSSPRLCEQTSHYSQGYLINFFVKDSETGFVDVVADRPNFNGSSKIYRQESNQYAVSGSWSGITGSASYARIPIDTWVNMRMKFDIWSTTGDILVYFNNAEGSSGVSGSTASLIAKPDASNPELLAKWTLGSLTFLTQNMRAINAVPGSNDNTHINNLFSKVDVVTNDDKEVSVMIDRVSFYGWNTLTSNATVTPENFPPNQILMGSSEFARPVSGTNIHKVPSNKDKYYGEANVPTSNYVSLGFETAVALDSKFAFFSNFNTSDQNNVQGLPFVSGGFFTNTTYNTYSGSSTWFSNMTVGTAAGKGIRIGGFDNSVDRFTQKGAIQFNNAGAGNFSGWAKKGNPLHASIIKTIGSNGKTITVDKPEIFDLPLDTEYVIERIDSIGSSLGYSTAIKQSEIRDGNTIQLNRSILTGTNIDNIYEAGNLTNSKSYNKIAISPKKYWVNMMIPTVSSSTFGDWYETVSGSAMSRLQGRSYSSVLMTSNAGATDGTTYNEYLFNDGIYSNRHNLDFTSDKKSIIDLSVDYGFGRPDDADTDSFNSGYITRDFLKLGTNYLDLTKYIEVAKPKLGDVFNFAIKPSFPRSNVNTIYTSEIKTKDNASPSFLVFGLEDKIPEVTNLEVSPVVDYTAENINIAQMTQENAADLIFTWNEKGNDVWYRVLWVDDKLINNKYNRTNFWLPLSGNTASVGYYTSDVDTTQTALTGTNTPDLFASMGYATKLNGSLVLTKTGNSVTVGATDQFTFMAHLKPTAGATDQDAFTVSGSSTEAFRLRVNSSNQVQIFIKNKAKTLTSTSIYDCDGEQPLSVIVTYKKTLDNNNLKLYVNGKLEDTADYTVDFEHDNNSIYVGGDGASGNKYTGYIEEITFHTKSAYILTNRNKARISSKHLSDLTGTNKSINYQARLFLIDYHNIRGKDDDAVAQSNSTSWKITGLT
tara:strand:+ start:752 stop:4930 length:4179 start_codon:yes stop_codon:yes gene_type:complete